MWYFRVVFFIALANSKELRITLQTSKSNPKNSTLKQWDLTMDNLKPASSETANWCKIFETSSLKQKHHIIGYKPLIGAKSSSLKHATLRECVLDQNDDLKRWNSVANENGELCTNPDMYQKRMKCLNPLIVWFKGSDGEKFPKQVGLSLEKDYFYMIELNFQISDKAQGRSGLRLFLTSQLRENEGAILTTGIIQSNLHFIPPHQEEYHTSAYCSTDCTKKTFPKNGIKIVSAWFPAHSAAKKLSLKRVRNGTKIMTLFQDDSEKLKPKTENATILPGDGLLTECTFSTTNRKEPIVEAEMCVAFVLYYPKIEMPFCSSMPSLKHFFELVGMKEFEGYTLTDAENLFMQGNVSNVSEFGHFLIKEPKEFKNKTFKNYLEGLWFNKTSISNLDQNLNSGRHIATCKNRNNSYIINPSLMNLPGYPSLKKSGSASIELNCAIFVSWILFKLVF